MNPLAAIEGLFSHYSNRWVVIGGIAVSIIAQPRFTADLDVMVLLTNDDIPLFLEKASIAGIEPRIKDAITFAEKNRVLLLRHRESMIDIDVSMGFLPFEQEMVERGKIYQVTPDVKLVMPTPEDLIIMKAFAGRPKDLEDIRIILAKYPEVDKERIRKLVKAFSEVLDNQEMWNNLILIIPDV